MNYASQKRSYSPAQRAIHLCWSRCVATARCKKYLQSTEILGLIRELERFLGVPSLLKPDEESLLRRTILNKPQLRLFRGECVSFILGLVHFGSVEEFLAARFRISAEALRELVEKSEIKGTGSLNKELDHGLSASAASRYQPEPRQSSYYKPEPPGTWDSKKDANTQIPGSSSWYTRWKNGLSGVADESEWRKGPYRAVSVEGKLDDLERRGSETKPGWFASVRNWISGPASGSVPKTGPLLSATNVAASEPLHRQNPAYGSRYASDATQVKTEETPERRRIRELTESLAEVRSQTLNLQNKPVVNSDVYGKRPGEKTMEETLDELQTAVREQARLISRLEREKSAGMQLPKKRGPGITSSILIPWDYFTRFTTAFLRDLIEELWPSHRYWTVPESLVRAVSVVLGYFVLLNFFRLVYLLAILVTYSSDTGVPYVYDLGDYRESAPVSWIQQFPLIEYWDYRIRDWWGS